MKPLTSDELNYLIFRYLNESGFAHSAFTLGYEAGMTESSIDGNSIPPGALIKYVQKGIQYLELEANLSNDDADIDEDFQFLQRSDLITKDAQELQKIIEEKKENLPRKKDRKDAAENDREHEREPSQEREREKQQRERIQKDKEREKGKDKEKPHEDIPDIKQNGNKISVKHKENGTGGGQSSKPIKRKIMSLEEILKKTKRVELQAGDQVGAMKPEENAKDSKSSESQSM